MPRRLTQPLLFAVIAIPLALLTFRQSRDYRDAETLYRATLARNPGCWLCHTNLALMFRGDASRTAEALSHAKAALDLRPDAPAHNNMGALLQAAGRFEDALTHYRTAVRLDPGYGEAHNNAGGLLQAFGRVDEAIVHIQSAVRLDPQNASAHDNLGTALSRAGRLEEALVHFRTALQIDPGFVSARNNLATALAALGRIGEAIAEYEQALKANPHDVRTHDNLAFALANTGQYPRARHHAEEALRVDPNYAPARVTLGTLLLQSGRPADAIAPLTLALDRPDLVDVAHVHTVLGTAYTQRDERDLAIRHFEAALQVRPDLADVRARLAALRRAR